MAPRDKWILAGVVTTVLAFAASIYYYPRAWMRMIFQPEKKTSN